MGKKNLGRNATFFTTAFFAQYAIVAIWGVVLYWLYQRKRRPNGHKYVYLTIFVFSSAWFLLMSTDAGLQFIDMSIMRSETLHDFFQTSENHTVVPHHDHLIVFQHIPRTAGDSMRTHGFFNLSLEYVPMRKNDPESPPKPYEFATDITRNATVIKGYWSSNDLEQIKNRPLKVFTFLRDPIERVISFYDFVGSGSAEEYFDFNSAYYADEKDGKRRYEHAASFIHNSMTYQLGDNMHIDYRDNSIPEREVLENAKRHLESMEFVGFYENLGWDFWSLRSKLFSDVQVPFVYPVAFFLGGVLGYPRLRVLKYQAQVSTEVLQMIEKLNRLDIELYSWARVRFHQDYSLHLNYFSFAISTLPSLVMGTFILALCLFVCHFLFTRFCAKSRDSTILPFQQCKTSDVVLPEEQKEL